MEIAIDTASVTTGDTDKGSRPRSRDEHLRSADFFNAAEFPKMTYKSTKVTFNGDNSSIRRRQPHAPRRDEAGDADVDRFKCNPAQANRKERCGGAATGKLKRSEFGMKTGIPSSATRSRSSSGSKATRTSGASLEQGLHRRSGATGASRRTRPTILTIVCCGCAEAEAARAWEQ